MFQSLIDLPNYQNHHKNERTDVWKHSTSNDALFENNLMRWYVVNYEDHHKIEKRWCDVYVWKHIFWLMILCLKTVEAINRLLERAWNYWLRKLGKKWKWFASSSTLIYNKLALLWGEAQKKIAYSYLKVT